MWGRANLLVSRSMTMDYLTARREPRRPSHSLVFSANAVPIRPVAH